jgi:hypothetical protein
MAFERDLGSSYNLLESESATPEDNGTGVVHVARRSTIVVSNPILAPTGVGLTSLTALEPLAAVCRLPPYSPKCEKDRRTATLSEHVPCALSRVASANLMGIRNDDYRSRLPGATPNPST